MEKFMIEAIKEAKKAYKNNEIPVGAVIVKDNKIVARGHNTRQKEHNLLGHAEINCILKAEKKIKDWRLNDCDLYVTLEPCAMCMMFIKEARINSVKFLLEREKNKRTNVRNLLKKEYGKLMDDFFKNLRQ